MSSNGNVYGLPLAAPSIQTILPVITSKGRLMGFYPIASTTFNGSERSINLSDYNNVPITSVTLPTQVQDGIGTGTGGRVRQYMAAQWPENQEGLRPWLGSASLVNPDETGYYSWWSLPTESIMKHFGRGNLINSLLVRMNIVPATPGTPSAPAGTNAGFTWVTSVNSVSLDTECPFIDFNWVQLFQTGFETDPSQQGVSVLPVRIDTVSNPVGGEFRAAIVQTLGGQQSVAGGSVIFNTVRIMKLADDVAAGDYAFAFNISYVKDGTLLVTPVTLTLTVV
jgi:hypothetical protein